MKLDYSLVRLGYSSVKLDCNLVKLGYSLEMLDYSLVKSGCNLVKLGCSLDWLDYIEGTMGYIQARLEKTVLNLGL